MIKTIVSALVLAGLSLETARAAAVTIRSTDAVWNYAGTVAGPGSTAPMVTPITPGAGQVLTFSSVSGTVSLTPGYSYGPDGGVSCPPGACPINILPAAGLSGIVSGHSAFLAGVFLNGNETANGHAAPPTLSFASFSFAALAPLDDQVFFIGDGLTGSGDGVQQTFSVPVDATALVLGITDADGYSGPPGAYFDNAGAFAATFAISVPTVGPAPVPEPATWSLLAVGTAVGFVTRRRGRVREILGG